MAKKAKKVVVPKKARQKALPGMESRGIAAIERAAHAYVDARDQRMAVGEEEQRRHAKLIAVMKSHGKTTYLHRDGDEMIDIKISAKDPEEKAKVKIKPVDEYTAPVAPLADDIDTEAEAVDTDTDVLEDVPVPDEQENA